MTVAEALQILVDCAGRWGENSEEGFAARVKPDMTDDECRQLAERSDVLTEEVMEVRDLWLAVEVASREINHAVQAAPR